MLLLIWIHVCSMVTAFAVFVGVANAVRVIALRADLHTIRGAVATTEPLFRAGGLAATIGVIAGLVLARSFGYTALWLIGAYVLTILATVLGIAIEAPWARRIAASDESGVEIIRRERLPLLCALAGFACWLAILWLMIAKPS